MAQEQFIPADAAALCVPASAVATARSQSPTVKVAQGLWDGLPTQNKSLLPLYVGSAAGFSACSVDNSAAEHEGLK